MCDLCKLSYLTGFLAAFPSARGDCVVTVLTERKRSTWRPGEARGIGGGFRAASQSKT